MLDLKIIGETIMHYREEKHMTQQDLADYLYVTRQAISKWETGKSIPSIEMMVELTKLFKISIDDFLYGQKKKNQDFAYLLNHYPRTYVVHQYIKGNIDYPLEDILYLLSPEERELMVTQIIKRKIVIDLETLFPYLTIEERKRLILAFKNHCDFNWLLTLNEKKLLEGKR